MALKPLIVFICSLYFHQAQSVQCLDSYKPAKAIKTVRAQQNLDQIVQSITRDLTISLQMGESVTSSFENAMKKLKFQVSYLNESGFINIYERFSKPDQIRGEIEQRMEIFLNRYSELNQRSGQLAENLKGDNVKLENKLFENLARVDDIVKGLHSDIAFFRSREDYLSKLKASLAKDFQETTKYAEENRLIFDVINQVKTTLWENLNSGGRVDEKLALMISLFNSHEQKSIADQSKIDIVQNHLQKTGVQLEQLKQSIDLSHSLTIETALISRGLTPSRVQMLLERYHANIANIKRDDFKLTMGQRFKKWTGKMTGMINADSVAVALALSAVSSLPISIYQDYSAAAKFNERVQVVSAESTKNVPEALIQNLKNSENAEQVGSAMLNSLNPESVVFVVKYLPMQNKFGAASVGDLEVLETIFNQNKSFSRKFTKDEIREMYDAMKIRKEVSYDINEDGKTDKAYNSAYNALNEMVLRNQNVEDKK
jgi:phosphoribosylanthranilate isomerase